MLKGSESVYLNDDNARFTTASLKAKSDHL